MKIKRINPGYYLMTDAFGVEWKVERRWDGWRSVSDDGDTFEPFNTLREVKRAILGGN